jgi:hypothetical protein
MTKPFRCNTYKKQGGGDAPCSSSPNVRIKAPPQFRSEDPNHVGTLPIRQSLPHPCAIIGFAAFAPAKKASQE